MKERRVEMEGKKKQMKMGGRKNWKIEMELKKEKMRSN